MHQWDWVCYTPQPHSSAQRLAVLTWADLHLGGHESPSPAGKAVCPAASPALTAGGWPVTLCPLSHFLRLSALPDC